MNEELQESHNRSIYSVFGPDAMETRIIDHDQNVDVLVEPGTRATNGRTTHLVYLLTLLSAIGGFLFGYDTGVVSGAVVLLKDEFSLTSIWQEVFISITMAAAALFALVSGYTNDRFGRKPTILLASFVFTLGSVVLAASNQRWMLIVGRFTIGVGIGFASATVPMYIAECAPSDIRGQLVTLNNVFITGGQFVACLFAGAFSYDKQNGWRYMLGLAAVPSFIQFVGFMFMPESPRWLVSKGRIEEAYHLLLRLDGDQASVENDLIEIQKSSSESSGLSIAVLSRIFSTPHVRRALVIGMLLQVFQQICGINTVMYYSATIIQMSGVHDVSLAIWLASFTAGINFVFTFVGLCLVERIGRRPLIIASLCGVMFSLLVLAIGFQLSAMSSPSVSVYEAFNSSNSCDNYVNCDRCTMDANCGFCFEPTSGGPTNGSCLQVATSQSDESRSQSSFDGRCHGNFSSNLEWSYGFCPTNYAWMSTFGLALYLVFFAPGMGPMPWTLNSEIYPAWARSTGNSLATCVNWISNLAISLTFLTLTEAITRYGAFYLYAGFALIGIVFLVLYLPETKGKQLEEVEAMFIGSPIIPCKKNVCYETMN